jgi:hypothetical protein
MRLTACSVFVVLGAIVTARAQTAAPASVDACALLTKDDAAAALGEAVTGPKSTRTPSGPSACEYTGSGLHRVQLNVIPFTPEQAGMYKAMCAQKKKDGLTGLGDTACWYNDKHQELQVLKGTMLLTIEMTRSGDPTEAIKAAAQKVYARAK